MTAREPLPPNALVPCPSDSCSRWHLAHGIVHDCQINIPDERRLQGGRRLRRSA